MLSILVYIDIYAATITLRVARSAFQSAWARFHFDSISKCEKVVVSARFLLSTQLQISRCDSTANKPSVAANMEAETTHHHAHNPRRSPLFLHLFLVV